MVGLIILVACLTASKRVAVHVCGIFITAAGTDQDERLDGNTVLHEAGRHQVFCGWLLE